MAGTTYSKFFWADYMSDKELLMCSLASQAVWMRMLCIAADAGHGNVLIGGKPPSPGQIAILCGLGVTAEQIEAAISELERWSVFSRRADGTIYSRRMERDEKKRRQSSNAGKSSAASRQGSKKGISFRSNDITQRTASTTINHQPESINQSPSTINHQPPKNGREDTMPGTVVSLEDRYSESEQLCRALGFSMTDDIRRQNWPIKLLQLKNEGIPFDALLEAAKNMREAGLVPVDVYSPAILKVGALAILRKRDRENANRPKAPSSDMCPREEWIARVRIFLRVGLWGPEFGPMPIEDGFLGDDDIADKACIKWEQQKNAPEWVHVGSAEMGYFEVYGDKDIEHHLPKNMKHPIPVSRSRRKIG